MPAGDGDVLGWGWTCPGLVRFVFLFKLCLFLVLKQCHGKHGSLVSVTVSIDPRLDLLEGRRIRWIPIPARQAAATVNRLSTNI